MTEPLRILHVFGRTGRGGAESRMMDILRAIDRDRVQFDFLVHTDASAGGKRVPSSDELMAVRGEDDYDEEIRALGGRIYALPRPQLKPGRTGFIAYRSACEQFFREYAGTWRMVQGHMTSTASIYLAQAGRAGVPVTIAHARSAGTDPGWKGMVTRAMRLPLSREDRMIRRADKTMKPLTDFRFACSKEAARAVFGHAPTVILPNAIPLDRYRFQPEVRRKLRKELGLDDSRVVGHVGSFRYAKNHEFLLRTFALMTRMMPDSDLRLLLVGKGGLLTQMQELAGSLGIRERVVFAGDCPNVQDYYQAMDVFAFPSRYEGLPGSVIEAQAAGLCCLISDAVTPAVDATPFVSREQIGDQDARIREAEKKWAQELTGRLADGGEDIREARSAEACGKLELAGFDALAQAAMLMRFYETGGGLPEAVRL